MWFSFQVQYRLKEIRAHVNLSIIMLFGLSLICQSNYRIKNDNLFHFDDINNTSCFPIKQIK